MALPPAILLVLVVAMNASVGMLTVSRHQENSLSAMINTRLAFDRIDDTVTSRFETVAHPISFVTSQSRTGLLVDAVAVLCMNLACKIKLKARIAVRLAWLDRRDVVTGAAASIELLESSMRHSGCNILIKLLRAEPPPAFQIAVAAPNRTAHAANATMTNRFQPLERLDAVTVWAANESLLHSVQICEPTYWCVKGKLTVTFDTPFDGS